MNQYTLYLGGFMVASVTIVVMCHLIWEKRRNSLPTPPHWLDAFKIIWCDIYLMPWESRPRVIWVDGKAFNSSSGQLTASESDSVAVTVAMETDMTPVSSTAVAHELWHVALRLKGLRPDGEHVSSAWGLGGVVSRANEELRSRGW